MQIHFVEAPNNFYLGARINPETGEVIPSLPLYYDARDLTTHGVILGMTGSGKSGLGITILEEAAIDGIPQLIIDPKGDITNMLLAFPDLTAEHFQPWVEPKDALRNDQDLDTYAKTVANQWRNGLTEWGITPERIQEYRRAARFSIYTPGSDSGLPVSILASFAAPAEGWTGNEEILREQIAGIVTAILGLIGVSAQPVEDPEHILLSNIFEYNWRNGIDLSMEQLILQVQRPPFSKLGVLDVETVIPEKKRFDLAKQLNNIIAAPNFQTWIKGEPLHVPSLLYTPEGYPRATIFYIAHLDDAWRQFIVTLLLESVLTWMRSLSGSTSLRALVYVDEVFGMFPPYPQKPPTKEPIMRLLKQGRAFGIGALVSTQNPKDIDYKGLSNAGTWFIGKLQTENDKKRVLEGLDSARDATSALNLDTVDKLIGRLQPREFIMHNIHEPDTPILMRTRWAMSYLRGPLTRQQVSELMANQRESFTPTVLPQSPPSVMPAAPAADMQGGHAASLVKPRPQWEAAAGAPAAPVAPTYSVGTESAPPVATKPTDKEAPPGFSPAQPVLSSAVQQYFLPTEFTVEQSIRDWEAWTRQPAMNVKTRKRLLYRPALLGQTTVRFSHSQTNSADLLWYAFVVPNLPHVPYLEWSEYQSEPFDPHALEPHPFAEAYYAEVPQTLSSGSGFKDLRNNLVDWIYNNAALYVYHNPPLKLYSGLGESKYDFVARVQAEARMKRDEEIDKTAAAYDRRLDSLEDQARRKAGRLESEKEELEARKREEMLSAGETAWRLMKGSVYQTLSRAGRLRRFTSQSEDQIEMIESDLMSVLEDLDRTEAEMQAALEKVQAKWSDAVRQIEEVPVTPYKKDINIVLFGIGWVPYWDVEISGAPVVLPASSSGLSQSQQA